MHSRAEVKQENWKTIRWGNSCGLRALLRNCTASKGWVAVVMNRSHATACCWSLYMICRSFFIDSSLFVYSVFLHFCFNWCVLLSVPSNNPSKYIYYCTKEHFCRLLAINHYLLWSDPTTVVSWAAIQIKVLWNFCRNAIGLFFVKSLRLEWKPHLELYELQICSNIETLARKLYRLAHCSGNKFTTAIISTTY